MFRRRQDSNLCGHSPSDFESDSLTTRTRLLLIESSWRTGASNKQTSIFDWLHTSTNTNEFYKFKRKLMKDYLYWWIIILVRVSMLIISVDAARSDAVSVSRPGRPVCLLWADIYSWELSAQWTARIPPYNTYNTVTQGVMASWLKVVRLISKFRPYHCQSIDWVRLISNGKIKCWNIDVEVLYPSQFCQLKFWHSQLHSNIQKKLFFIFVEGGIEL